MLRPVRKKQVVETRQIEYLNEFTIYRIPSGFEYHDYLLPKSRAARAMLFSTYYREMHRWNKESTRLIYDKMMKKYRIPGWLSVAYWYLNALYMKCAAREA